MRAVALLTFCSLIGPCTSDFGVQPQVANVQLTLQVAPSFAGPASPATISAEAANLGPGASEHADGCGAGIHGLELQLLNPQSRPVYLSDPRFRLLCPTYYAIFRPGETVSGEWQFTGTLYDSAGNQFQAGRGPYTAIVSFQFSSGMRGEVDSTIHQQASFSWISG